MAPRQASSHAHSQLETGAPQESQLCSSNGHPRCLGASGPRNGVREWGGSSCTTLPGPALAERQWQLVRELANFQPRRSSQTLIGCLSRPCGSVHISPLLQGPFLLGTGPSFFTTHLDLAHSPRPLCAAFLLAADTLQQPLEAFGFFDPKPPTGSSPCHVLRHIQDLRAVPLPEGAEHARGGQAV